MAGMVIGGIVVFKVPYELSLINFLKVGSLSSFAQGLIKSHVAPSSPIKMTFLSLNFYLPLLALQKLCKLIGDGRRLHKCQPSVYSRTGLGIISQLPRKNQVLGREGKKILGSTGEMDNRTHGLKKPVSESHFMAAIQDL